MRKSKRKRKEKYGKFNCLRRSTADHQPFKLRDVGSNPIGGIINNKDYILLGCSKKSMDKKEKEK